MPTVINPTATNDDRWSTLEFLPVALKKTKIPERNPEFPWILHVLGRKTCN
jgi:hypothetical protein